MRVHSVLSAAGYLLAALASAPVRHCPAQEQTPCPASIREPASDTWFSEEVWKKVAVRRCIRCHKRGGDAEETRLVLREYGLAEGDELRQLTALNRDAFTRMARLESAGAALLTLKAIGDLDHGGGSVVERDSAEFRILERFVQRIRRPQASRDMQPSEIDIDDLFDGVTMLDNRQLLRKAVLSLAGRLPTPTETEEVRGTDPSAVLPVLEKVMREEAFYDRLREVFNDIFLTLGVEGNPDSTVLSYEHFEKTRLWYQQFDLSHIADEKERRQAGYKLAADYRSALLDEPMRLIDHVVRHDRPFTEIVTADYIMMSPYTARGYGVFDEVRHRFSDPEDPFEYIPVRLNALVGRNRSEDQESETGFYPHAGVLSTFQYLSRYPTTETNRNRLRARMYFAHFLGVDVLELADRGSDAAAATAQFEIPTMQAAECVVCHRTLDPVAGLFQDYWRFDRNFAIYGRRKEGWFTDMFPAGFEGEQLPEEERWRALQWLGERTTEDPRFAVAMAEHAYFMLTGRRPLLPPEDPEDQLYQARLKAWRAQRATTESAARAFIAGGFRFRDLLRHWIVSDFYRADGLSRGIRSPDRAAELDDIGVVRMLSPEQLERKITAVFGRPWGRLTGQTAMLYGGIDSQEVTERASDPGGAMGAIQRTLSDDVACRNVAYDFSRPPAERLLFPHIEPDVLPGSSPESDLKIRRTVRHLHQRILGRDDDLNSPETDRTVALFEGVLADAAAQPQFDPRETWSCRQGLESPVPDPHYTVRAWRAVVTYLLRREEFLYE